MRSLLSLFLLPVFVMTLTSCSRPTVDASTNETLDQSLSSFYATLSPEDGRQLMSDISALNEYFQTRIYKGESAEDAQREYLKMLDGKSVKEIAEQVNRLKPYQAAELR